MNVAIRTDACNEIGIGHISRCITLALNINSSSIYFVCQKIPFYFQSLLKQKKINLIELDESYYNEIELYQKIDARNTIKSIKDLNISLMIVDHYRLDLEWELLVRNYSQKTLVIDDLPNRIHECDYYLDQTYGRKNNDCVSRVPHYCKLFVGTDYVLIKQEFQQLRPFALNKRKSVKAFSRILLSFGGTDEQSLIVKTLDIFSEIKWTVNPIIEIAISSEARNLNSIINKIKYCPFKVNLNIDSENMAELMLLSDLSIGSGGTTSWERCCLGLPTILVVLADNQRDIASNLEKAGAVIKMENDSEYSSNLKSTIEALQTNMNQLVKISENAFKICDGNGVINLLKELSFE